MEKLLRRESVGGIISSPSSSVKPYGVSFLVSVEKVYIQTLVNQYHLTLYQNDTINVATIYELHCTCI